MNSSEALKIIRTLADGIDPTTGEVFDTDSPYQNPLVIRALFSAIEALSSRVKQEKRESRLPLNAGKPWPDDEDKELVENFKRNVSLAELSRKHQRTQGSIKARLVKHGLMEYHNPPHRNQI